jgi:hypothetical protein
MLWWLLLAALAVVALVLWLARSRPQAGPRPGTRPRPSPPPTAKARPAKTKPTKGKPAKGKPATTGPQPGEIWWADVPYEDYSGHKVRPCVVLRTGGGFREVLKITSQDQSHRDDHVRIPTKTWDAGADHDSYLDLTGPVKVAVAKFDDRAGSLDPAIWRKVRRLYKL